MSKEESKLEWIDPRFLAFKEDIIKMVTECDDDKILNDIFDILKENYINQKEEIIELINSRIKYYTGGEAWKSLNESICDKRIVDELESIKENILKQNKEDE